MSVENEPEAVEVRRPARELTEAQKLLRSTIAMREALHPKEKTRSEKAIEFISYKTKPVNLKMLGQRAGLCMQGINIGEQEQLLFFDDTYALEVFNIQANQVVGNLPINSYQLKCMLIAESKLFVGLTTGEIVMYDPFTLELIDKANTYRHSMPNSMVLQSAGTLLVGMTSGSLEVFSFGQNSIQSANPVVNEIKVPFAGEIYSM